MSTKRIRPNVLPALKDALSLAFWYRSDLRTHLSACIPGNGLIAQLDWTDYKRNIVRQLVDTMAAQQERYFEDLLSLILSTAEITDPAHLKRVEDGAAKYADAVAALNSLRELVGPYQRIRDEADEADRRREVARNRAAVARAVEEKIAELKIEFFRLVTLPEQERGLALEGFLNSLFAVFDIDSKGAFRISGQQIDGAFSLDGTEFIVEAKWQAGKTPIADLMVFAGKIRGKLDNTLGLFVSMNGYQQTALDQGADGRPVMILMDGADLMAVLESRIELPELLKRKRQHASQTGETFLSAANILG